ncbi:hypothetical protein M758_3G206100 [Ceratodon purpureus]|nr:hypothetical protein M758_3G206100 [Ceratodon purpureus]
MWLIIRVVILGFPAERCSALVWTVCWSFCSSLNWWDSEGVLFIGKFLDCHSS